MLEHDIFITSPEAKIRIAFIILFSCLLSTNTQRAEAQQPVDPNTAVAVIPQPSSTECTANLAAPFSTRRSLAAYQNTESFRECSMAARALNSQAAALPIDERNLMSSPSFLARPDKFHIAAAVRTYSDACLVRFDDPEMSSALWPEQRDFIASRVGVLSHNGRVFCVGTAISPNSIITAKHCFAEKTSGGWSPYLPRDGTTFRTFRGQSYDIHVAPDHIERHMAFMTSSNLHEDWTVLEAVPAGSEDFDDILELPIRRDLAAQWQPLILASVQPYLRAILELDQDPSTERGFVPSLDISSICMVIIEEEGYLLHGCQTEAGMSGSPLFTIDENDNIVLIGLHTGETSLLDTPCSQRFATNFPNYGIAVPELHEANQ